MKTTVCTLQGGVLSCNGIVNNVHRNPSIILYNRDEALSKAEILDLLNLSEAKVDAYVTYFCNENGKSEKIDYYMYEIFI